MREARSGGPLSFCSDEPGMDKQSTPEITGQAADAGADPNEVVEASHAAEQAVAPEPDTAEAPAAPASADAPTYERRVVDPNLRSTADGRLLTSADEQK